METDKKEGTEKMKKNNSGRNKDRFNIGTGNVGDRNVGDYNKGDDNVGFKQAFQDWWKAASSTQRSMVLALPNFDAVKFAEITGVEVGQ